MKVFLWERKDKSRCLTGSICYDHTLSLNDGGDHYKFQENSFHWLARKDSRQRLLRWEYNKLLHFAWGVDDAECIVVTRVCVSVRGRMPTLLHGPGCNLGTGMGCACCALLGGFAIGARHGLRCYGNITGTRNVTEYMIVLALCVVILRLTVT